MESVIIEFSALNAALAFLQRTSPASPEDAWTRLGGVWLLSGGRGSAVALECSSGVMDATDFATAKQCGGQLDFESRTLDPWTERLGMQKLFRQVQLQISNLTDSGTHFLVIPQGLDISQTRDLIDSLSEIEGCSVWFRDVRMEKATAASTIFELRVEGETPIPAPLGLAGAPQVLTAVEEDVFVPSGLRHSLLPAHRFLFPPTGEEKIHAWLIGPKGTPAYVELSTSATELVPLAKVILLPKGPATPLPAVGVDSHVKLPLRLRCTNERRRLRRASQVVYIVVSRAGELGNALLRLLDHAEARIEHFTYFNRAARPGPNALVEHFLLTEARLADDDLWPELRRFDLPAALGDIGLPLFIPADSDFSPDVEGIMRGIDADDPFLIRLRETVGLANGGSDRLALVELGAGGGEWRITTLEKGRPLGDLVSVVLEDFGRESVRRIVDVSRVDLSEDRRRHEGQLMAAGLQECKDLAETTQRLVITLVEAARSAENELTRLQERVEGLREASLDATELVTDCPRVFSEFLERLVRLVESLALPRRAWLTAAQVQGQASERLLAAALDLQHSIQGEVDGIAGTLAGAETELGRAGQRLELATASLQRASEQLQPQARSAEVAAEQASSAIQGRHERVLAQQAQVATRERALLDRSNEVDRFEQGVQAREQEVARRTRELESRRRELEARLREAERAERQARDNESALRHLETVELPSARNRREEAQRDLATWQAKALDQQLRDVQSEVQGLEQETALLRSQEERLHSLHNALTSLRVEAGRLRNEVDRMGKMALEREAESGGKEPEQLASETPLEKVAHALQDAYRCIKAAAAGFQSAQLIRALETLAKATNELGSQLCKAGTAPEGTDKIRKAPAEEKKHWWQWSRREGGR